MTEATESPVENHVYDMTSRTEFTDSFGNHLSIRLGQIIIFLKNAPRRNGYHVGDFYAASKTFYKKENDKGIFRKFNAFGFCYSAIKITDPEEIVVDYKKERFTIKRQWFETVKKYLHFKDDGFELRIYVPLADFTKTVKP